MNTSPPNGVRATAIGTSGLLLSLLIIGLAFLASGCGCSAPDISTQIGRLARLKTDNEGIARILKGISPNDATADSSYTHAKADIDGLIAATAAGLDTNKFDESLFKANMDRATADINSFQDYAIAKAPIVRPTGAAPVLSDIFDIAKQIYQLCQSEKTTQAERLKKDLESVRWKDWPDIR